MPQTQSIQKALHSPWIVCILLFQTPCLYRQFWSWIWDPAPHNLTTFWWLLRPFLFNLTHPALCPLILTSCFHNSCSYRIKRGPFISTWEIHVLIIQQLVASIATDLLIWQIWTKQAFVELGGPLLVHHPTSSVGFPMQWPCGIKGGWLYLRITFTFEFTW